MQRQVELEIMAGKKLNGLQIPISQLNNLAPHASHVKYCHGTSSHHNFKLQALASLKVTMTLAELLLQFVATKLHIHQ